jgi:hypothetical protein
LCTCACGVVLILTVLSHIYNNTSIISLVDFSIIFLISIADPLFTSELQVWNVTLSRVSRENSKNRLGWSTSRLARVIKANHLHLIEMC